MGCEASPGRKGNARNRQANFEKWVITFWMLRLQTPVITLELPGTGNGQQERGMGTGGDSAHGRGRQHLSLLGGALL